FFWQSKRSQNTQKFCSRIFVCWILIGGYRMNEQIDIWLVGNTGLRNPNRIQDGFKVFAGSPFVGNLHGKDNEIGFMNYLDEKGIIQNEDGKDESGSHARKWRLMFAKNGFIYPQVKKKDGKQEELGPLDDITPFGRSFLKADT